MFCYQFDTYMATIPIPEQQSKTQKKFLWIEKNLEVQSKFKTQKFQFWIYGWIERSQVLCYPLGKIDFEQIRNSVHTAEFRKEPE